MNKNGKPGKHDDAERPDLQRNVHEALKSIGWTAPECEDDVRRAEAESAAGAAPLPGSLADAAAVFEGKAGGGLANVCPAAFSPDAQVEENLARAARGGGKIPPEIEERMRRDREDAEDALEQEEPES